MMKIRAEFAFGIVAFALGASPAFAVAVTSAPAPIAGVGIAGAMVVGAGYRALKRRLGR